MDVALDLLAVAAIVAGNAFFVIAEYALVTARRSALQQRGRRGRRALALMDDPVRVISTVQIGITALGILLGAVGEPVFTDMVSGALPSGLAFAFGFLVVTYLSVAFGELVPKALALHAAERVAVVVAPLIDVLSRAVWPVVVVLQASAAVILRPLGIPAVTAGERPISREELRGVLQEAEEYGTLRADEEDMLTGVIDLRLREAGDVMRPWEDVVWVRVDGPGEEAIETMFTASWSRFPALAGENEVVGVLHVRDVWTAWRAADGGDVDLRGLARPAVIVPPTVRIDALLRMLRRERQQMAVVVDEYGRPAGIVTIEDILEEIVGEIEDEFDVLDERFERLGARAWMVDGSVSVSDFNRRTGARLDPGRARSVGGQVFDHFGRVPAVGESVVLDGVKLTVKRLDGHRIDLVRADLPQLSDENDAA